MTLFLHTTDQLVAHMCRSPSASASASHDTCARVLRPAHASSAYTPRSLPVDHSSVSEALSCKPAVLADID